MVLASLKHLTPDGIIAAQFGEWDIEGKPNRTTRYVATARAALEELGVKDASQHVLVSSGPGFGPQHLTTILVKRQPLTDAERERLRRGVAMMDGGRVEFDGGATGRDRPFGMALTLPDRELAAWTTSQTYDRSAITDDAPFFWHFVRFHDAIRDLEG